MSLERDYKIVTPNSNVYWYLQCFDCKRINLDKVYMNRETNYMHCVVCANKKLITPQLQN